MSTLDPHCFRWLRGHVCNGLNVSDSNFDACLADDSANALVAAFLAGEGVTSIFFQCDERQVCHGATKVQPSIPQPGCHEAATVDKQITPAGVSEPEAKSDISVTGIEVTVDCPMNRLTPCASGSPSDDHGSMKDSGHHMQSTDKVAPPHSMGPAVHGRPVHTSTDGEDLMSTFPNLQIVVSRIRQVDKSSAAVFAVRRHGEALTASTIHAGVDIGFLPAGEPLKQVSGILQQVFMPLLSHITGSSYEKVKAHASPGQHSPTDTELSAALEKYVSQLRTSEAHLTGSVQLRDPPVDSFAATGSDDDTLTMLESCIHEWTLVLQEVKHAESEKIATGDGPLDEIYFWREKNNVLGGLHEQIHMARAQRIIEYALEMQGLVNIWCTVGCFAKSNSACVRKRPYMQIRGAVYVRSFSSDYFHKSCSRAV
eukprot:jgi/Ulvmu1/10604/UM065_0060.1